MQDILCRDVIAVLQKSGVAFPADFNALVQIGFRARHAVKQGGAELGLFAKYVGIGMEMNRSAALRANLSPALEFPLRFAARIFLLPAFFVADNLDRQLVRQGIDDGQPDAMQMPDAAPTRAQG